MVALAVIAMVALAVIALLAVVTGALAFVVGMIIWIYCAVRHRGKLWIGWRTLLGGITLFILGSVGITLFYLFLFLGSGDYAVFYEPRSDRAAETPPEMILIPAGPFVMGSTEDNELAYDNEHLQQEVELDAFRIGRYPVTNAQYARFVEEGGYENPAFWTEAGWAWREAHFMDVETAQPRYWEDPRKGPLSRWAARAYVFNQPDHPVVGVSWYEALAYCRWLSEATGQAFRLPTEAEWEKAASWDPEAEKKRQYPWGDDFDAEKCNTREGGPGTTTLVEHLFALFLYYRVPGTTTPVGQYSPAGDSPYGVADMAGNVWEWCQDWYAEDYYGRSPSENPPGPTEGDSRVLRGGSWFNDQGGARCAYRNWYLPDLRYDNGGFRVVVSPGSP